MDGAYFHFEDLKGNPINLHDFGDLKRGKTSPISKFYVVNDGPKINNISIKVSGSSYPAIALLENEQYTNEVNFPLQQGGRQLIKTKITIPGDAHLGPGEAVLDAVVNLNFNQEYI